MCEVAEGAGQVVFVCLVYVTKAGKQHLVIILANRKDVAINNNMV